MFFRKEDEDINIGVAITLGVLTPVFMVTHNTEAVSAVVVYGTIWFGLAVIKNIATKGIK